jgi:hypothetical protein
MHHDLESLGSTVWTIVCGDRSQGSFSQQPHGIRPSLLERRGKGFGRICGH